MEKRLAPKILTALAVVALIVLAAPAPKAGDYHFGATLLCQECHVMHFSQSHGYNSDGGGITTPLSTTGPHEYLLRNEVNALCLACHDNQTFAPDVFEGNGGVTTDIRQAGALSNSSTTIAPYYPQTGHSLGSMAVAPGGTWSNSDGFNCVDCHNPHGYTANAKDVYSETPGAITNAYRNLETQAGGDAADGYNISYVVEGGSGNDQTKDVYERFAAEYDISDVDFNEPDTTQSAMAEWCQKCHPDFHGDVGGGEIGGSIATGAFERHPNSEVDIGGIGGRHSSTSTFGGRLNRVKVMSPSDDWGTQGVAWTLDGTDLVTPTCISCHKAHGNQNAFGLIYMRGTGTVTEQGDDGTAVRDLCKQCHVQGE